MSELLWYLAGMLTIPVGGVLVGLTVLALSRNTGCECDVCGKVMGEIGATPRIVTEARWRAHYLKYWYRTRPNWTCATTK